MARAYEASARIGAARFVPGWRRAQEGAVDHASTRLKGGRAARREAPGAGLRQHRGIARAASVDEPDRGVDLRARIGPKLQRAGVFWEVHADLSQNRFSVCFDGLQRFFS